MQDQSNGNGVLDDSEIELALSIVTDRNATSKAVRDGALLRKIRTEDCDWIAYF